MRGVLTTEHILQPTKNLQIVAIFEDGSCFDNMLFKVSGKGVCHSMIPIRMHVAQDAAPRLFEMRSRILWPFFVFLEAVIDHSPKSCPKLLRNFLRLQLAWERLPAFSLLKCEFL